MMIFLAGNYLYAEDTEEVQDDLGDYTITITVPDSSPAYFPFGTPIGTPVELDAQVNPEPVNGGTITWDFNEQGTMGVGSWYFNAAKPIVYLFTALFNKDGKTVPSQPVIIGFPKVEIEEPQGSHVEKTSPDDTNWHNNFPADSVLCTPNVYPIRYDFQGVIKDCLKSYPIKITGIVEDSQIFNPDWTLEEAAGKLDTNDTDPLIDPLKPVHTEPVTPGVGVLKLTALDVSNLDENGLPTNTKVSVERKLRVYQDHLERDFENFNGFYWLEVYMGGKPIKTFPCFQSVTHAYNGTYQTNGYPWLFEGRDWERGYPNGKISCDDFQARSITLERGDVIGYYIATIQENGKYDCPDDNPDGNKSIAHANTMINPFEAWGSNNEVYLEGDYFLRFASIYPEDYCLKAQMRTSRPYCVQVYRKPKR